jgi:uncharacterized protein YjcR
MKKKKLCKKTEEMENMKKLPNMHPQVFQFGIGVEAFVEDFIKAFTKYNEYSNNEKTSMGRLSELIKNFPHIIRSEIKTGAFLEEMSKVAERFEEYFKRPW